MLTPRQRYIETLTFGNPDKVPIYLSLARESTINQWIKEGLPSDRDYQDVLVEILGIDERALLQRNRFKINFFMIPEYEVKILEHKNGHYILRAHDGVIVEISDQYDASYLSTKTDFVTRQYHRFPVETRDDWEEMKKRYDPKDPARLPADFHNLCKSLANREHIEMIRLHGVFWQLREWCGFENLCMLFVDDPEFVREMADFWGDFVLEMFEQFLPYIKIDSIFIAEDMAYKARTMISPEMTREFILPIYKKWIPVLYKYGCPIIEMDSDGWLDELIPIWIEADAHCCSPIEVAAHCDLVDYRRKYGKQMAYLQGIDKRLIAKGGPDMERHVKKLCNELFREGGYLPGCDHGVPPDISWKNYIEYSRLLAHLCGWL